MKKITNYMKALGITVLLMAGITARAQSTCTANFVYTNQAGGVVTFTSLAAGTGSITSYYWSFGNGTTYTAMGISGMNAMTTYTANGSYVVTLFIMSVPSCSAGVQYTVNVTNAGSSGCAVNANFTSSQGTGGLMNFNNTSTGATGATYTWYFGDGSPSSSATSPNHTYAANGTYMVMLMAYISPSCYDSTTAFVTVNSVPGCSLNASFTYTQNNNGVVNFMSNSTGTTPGMNYYWYFGDGGSATGTSASHTYPSGTYYASLFVSGSSSVTSFCADSASHFIVVTNTCVANAGFTMVSTSTPQYWNAYPADTNVTGAQWSWGDGTTSSILYASHQYSAAGTYDICLTVTVACGAQATYCYPYSVYKGNSNSGVIHVNVKSPASIGTGLNESANDAVYTMYPNPNNGRFNVNITGLNASQASLAVYNLLGDAILTRKTDVANGAINEDIDLQSVKNGVYFVQVQADNKTYTRKIVVNK